MSSAVFFSWWRARLGELVPTFLRRRWGSVRAGITLSIDGEQVQIRSADNSQPVVVDLGGERPAETSTEIATLLAALPGGPQQIRLQLEAHDYLVRRFSLPRAAQGNLAEAVGYQLPQLTPFSADQLLYACGEADDSPSTGALSVWLVAVPRQRVERALAVIDQPAPHSPLQLRAPPTTGEALSLTWRASDLSPTSQRSMRIAWVALVALWIGVLGIHMFKQAEQQRMLDETLGELRTKAATVSQLHEQLARVRVQVEQVSELKASGGSPLMVLDRLSQALSDETWLLGMELRKGQLMLRGVSASPANLIETLEATDFLKDVSFDSAITRDGRSEGDRFNIRATLEKAQGRTDQ